MHFSAKNTLKSNHNYSQTPPSVTCKEIKRLNVVTRKDLKKKVMQTVVNECHIIPNFHPAQPHY